MVGGDRSRRTAASVVFKEATGRRGHNQEMIAWEKKVEPGNPKRNPSVHIQWVYISDVSVHIYRQKNSFVSIKVSSNRGLQPSIRFIYNQSNFLRHTQWIPTHLFNIYKLADSATLKPNWTLWIDFQYCYVEMMKQ